MSKQTLTLISHTLCPYVQRAVIVLHEKDIAFHRIDIDLNNKPAWFLRLSPLGKVPVLLIGDDSSDIQSKTTEAIALFESTVISEYIDDISAGTLLAEQPLARAQARAWIEYAANLLNNIGQLYSAKTESDYREALAALDSNWQTLDQQLSSGPYFLGTGFSLVDAAFAPALRYLPVLESLTGLKLLQPYPRLERWHLALSQRASVKQAVRHDYPQALSEFIAQRDSHLGNIARTSLTDTAA